MRIFWHPPPRGRRLHGPVAGCSPLIVVHEIADQQRRRGACGATSGWNCSRVVVFAIRRRPPQNGALALTSPPIEAKPSAAAWSPDRRGSSRPGSSRPGARRRRTERRVGRAPLSRPVRTRRDGRPSTDAAELGRHESAGRSRSRTPARPNRTSICGARGARCDRSPIRGPPERITPFGFSCSRNAASAFCEGHDLAVDPLLPHPAGDELRHLRAEVDDQHLVVLLEDLVVDDVGRQSRLQKCSLEALAPGRNGRRLPVHILRRAHYTHPASSRRTTSSSTLMPMSESLRQGRAAKCSPPCSRK